MPLEEYQAKRDFGATPEPSGGEPTPPGRPRRFVVQQHHARAMHWDFRLELDGVLLSWAVPKGPSLDTRDKRLAVHVEDHPLDYADFEGTIPPGEYGAGSVIVWDRGTWEPITDPHAGLEKGDFKFRLNGSKLVGGWVLVRLKPRPKDRGENWLLIKEKDEHVRPAAEYSITAERPESVISGVTVDEVGGLRRAGEVKDTVTVADPPQSPFDASGTMPSAAGARGDEGHSTTGQPASVPELALCTLVSAPPRGDGWLGEVKYDGYRMTATLQDGRVTCRSRNGEDLTPRVPGIADTVAALPAESAQIDGELVVFDDRGISRFGDLQEALSTGVGAPVLVAFDLLHLNGRDVRGLPTTQRKDVLGTLLRDLPPESPVRFAEYIEGGVDTLMEVACAQGLEGVVAKRADSPYPVGRTRAWLKVKCRRSQEFVVGGYTEPRGSRTGFGALLLGYYEGDKLVYAGRVGSGFSDAKLAALHGRLTAMETDIPAFADPPEGLKAHWVKPRLVVGVAFAEWTADGVLRQPSFLGIREDLEPSSVVRERVDDAPEQGANDTADRSAAPAGESGDGPTEVAGVRITNPAKRLFPESDLTKAELARYYDAVAELMLPEVGSRPLTLVRCPVGEGRGGCFYQRHPDRGLPAGIGVIAHMLSGHEEADEWLFVTDASGLVSLAQMGVAEIHTWASRVDAPLRPDRLVFDLDPGPDVSWADVVTGAEIVRETCTALGFHAFARITGSKGLHVVLPVEPVWEFVRARALSRAIAEKVAAEHPDRFTSKMSKALRPGRIFLDYVRNSEGASAVACYSTRYLEGPPVAVPLAWDELQAGDDVRRAFTPKRVLERVGAGIDPWRDIEAASAGARILKAAEKDLGL